MTVQPALFGPQISGADGELRAVAEELLERDPDGAKIARVLRRTYDMLLDGQHTGRYRWDQLSKTEKTHFGTLAEINLQRAFGFADGKAMDFAIRGVDVDCKFSQNPGDWMIPPEAAGQHHSRPVGQRRRGLWSAGLIRATDEVLTSRRGNRDLKRCLSPLGKAAVTWLFQDNAATGERPASDPAPRGADRSLPARRPAEAGGHAVPAGPAADHQPDCRRDRRAAGGLHEARPRQRRIARAACVPRGS